MARIFIAICFPDEFKQNLVGIRRALEARGVQGEYCPYNNLHMTLAFIGEKYDLPTIRKAISEVHFEPFTMTLASLGSFPTKSGVIWCGVHDCQPLMALAHNVRERLTAHGVPFSTLGFMPHISLVQHPSKIITDISVPQATLQISSIHLMKSERLHGILTYSEI